jgi:hypothetical protein
MSMEELYPTSVNHNVNIGRTLPGCSKPWR